MPVIRVYDGCPEMREVQTPGQFGSQGSKICGRPIYLNGVCDQCYRCNETLRGEYSPMQANAAAERMDLSGYQRLYVDDDTLREKGLLRDVDKAMENFEDELAELLGSQ